MIASAKLPGLPPEFYKNEDLSRPWFTANGLASRCRYVWNYAGFLENEVDNEWAFCKTDFLGDFLALGIRFSALFTHNSDIPVAPAGGVSVNYLSRPWFAVNAAVEHPKIRGLPLSIANAGWQHGDTKVIERVIAEPLEKDTDFYANFALWTNPAERGKCLRMTGVRPSPMLPFEGHLRAMRRARFCLSPRGSGIDCHRTWEALIVGTIPVVTRSIVARDHRDWPMVILDDWSDFRRDDFTGSRYDALWGEFRPEALHMDRYLDRLRERCGLV